MRRKEAESDQHLSIRLSEAEALLREQRDRIDRALRSLDAVKALLPLTRQARVLGTAENAAAPGSLVTVRMGGKEAITRRLACLRCGHVWKPVKPSPKFCPKCIQPWNVPRRDGRRRGSRHGPQATADQVAKESDRPEAPMSQAASNPVEEDRMPLPGLTVLEAAKLARCSELAIRVSMRDGRVRPIPRSQLPPSLSRRVLIPKEEIDRFIALRQAIRRSPSRPLPQGEIENKEERTRIFALVYSDKKAEALEGLRLARQNLLGLRFPLVEKRWGLGEATR
jgi:hypothetical protein